MKQIRQLRGRLKESHIRSRVENGVTLRYLEGWHVIAEANRIFGFDGWHRETVETSCVYTKKNGDRYEAVYVAKVRIRVEADGQVILREGTGCGEADTVSPGQAHDHALKAAETDATKRALMTFGNAFGLSLYAGNGSVKRGSQPCGNTSLNGAAALTDRNTASFAQETPSPASEPADPVTEYLSETAPRQKRIDKSALTLGEPKRLRDPDHLKFVARQPCLICGRNRAHAHHLTFAQPHALGRKVSDEFTVPLCSSHHRDLHQAGNEEDWWREHKLDPLTIADDLWAQSRNRTRQP